MFPKLFTIGSFYLPTYGVLVALGFLAGLSITVKLARKSGLDAEKITNLAVYVALAGLLGAKLLMIAFDWPDIQIFSLATLQAAGVFQGGLILALITAYFYIRHNQLPVSLYPMLSLPEWRSPRHRPPGMLRRRMLLG